MLMFGRNEHISVKQLSFNKKLIKFSICKKVHYIGAIYIISCKYMIPNMHMHLHFHITACILTQNKLIRKQS